MAAANSGSHGRRRVVRRVVVVLKPVQPKQLVEKSTKAVKAVQA